MENSQTTILQNLGDENIGHFLDINGLNMQIGYQQQAQHMRQNLQLFMHRNDHQLLDNIQPQFEVQLNNNFFAMDFSTAIAKYQLIYFCVLMVQLLYEGKLPTVCFAWIFWYLLLGTCWLRNNSNNFLLVVSQIFKVAIVTWGIFVWVYEPLNMFVYLFLLLNVDSIVRIPVMLCTSCLVCVCASSVCFLLIKVKLELKSKNEKKTKFLQHLQRQQKTIIKKNSSKSIQQNDFAQINDQFVWANPASNLISSLQTQDSSFEEYQCPICLANFQNKYVQVQCMHKFHYECIKTWLQTNNTCPICRKELY